MLEVDDLLKANKAGIDALYKKFASSGLGKLKFLTKDDAIKIFHEASFMEPKIFGGGVGGEWLVTKSYSLSRMTLEDEMGEFENYPRMQMCEFYEFLGRWAFLLFKDLPKPLDFKIMKLLIILLELVPVKFIEVK